MKYEYLEFLVNNGYQILKIYEDEMNSTEKGRFSYWISLRFDSAGSKDQDTFHYVKGIEITEFIETNTIGFNQKVFLERLEKYVDSVKPIVCKFHHLMKWKLYTAN